MTRIHLGTRALRRVRITLGSALLLSLLSVTGYSASAAHPPLRTAGASARVTTMPASLAPVVARTLPRDASVANVTWSQQAEITTTHHSFNDGIGNAVAISGTTALVSAIAKFNGRGAVYVFLYNGSAWTQQALLVASSPTFGAQFGESLALNGDTALIGAPMPLNPPQGAVFVFVRHGSTWTQQAELTSADGIPNDSFGWSVALNGDTALIGAPDHNTWTGSAYVFARHGVAWSQQAELTASDAATYNNFGSSVALNGSTALVGAPGWPGPPGISNFYEGKVYAFVHSGSAWAQQAAFIAGDATTSGRFGGAVALDGDTALIGATGKINNTGVAYVVVRSGSTWTQQAELRAGDASADHYFGQSVSLSGDTALIGAPALYPCSCIGSAYVFVRSGSAWAQQAELLAGDSVLRNFMGISVALSGGTALVGATGAIPFNGGAFGAAYVFVRNGTSGTAEPHGP